MPIPLDLGPPEPPGGGDDTGGLVYSSPIFTLTGASGTVLSLTGRGFSGLGLMAGSTGVGLAPPELFAGVVPDGDGSVFLGSRVGERQVFIPALIGARTYAGLRSARRGLEDVAGDGAVKITCREPDTGATRTVTGYYTGGLEGDYGRSVAGVDWQTVGLTFRCPDPFAYGVAAPHTWTVTTGVGQEFLSTTVDFFPVVLGDSLVGGRRTVLNAGDLPAWPVFTITGPGSGLEVENLTTGKSFALTGAITQPLTVDTRRGVADVFDADGDLWDRVVLGSSLWSLEPGANSVQVTLVDATSASGITLTMTPTFRSLR